MLIKEKELTHWINHFYGYGLWQAKIWFVAYEDGGGDVPEDVAERLTYFSHAHVSTKEATLCDIRDLYQQVSARLSGPRASTFKTLFDYRFGYKAIQHGVWKNLIAFVHGYRGKKLPNILTYQRNSFTINQEAWLQLYPLPSPHNHAWYYSWLDMPRLSFLKNRMLYQQHLLDARMQTFLKKMKEHKPEIVLMYGMENITLLKKSVQDFFTNVKFKTFKGIKLVIPQHHIAYINGTILIITTQIPALRHNRIETGFDWEEFGKRIQVYN